MARIIGILQEGWSLGWPERLGALGLALMVAGTLLAATGFGVAMVGFACRFWIIKP